jgi:ArpU family phage transcriptional regulator
MHLAHSWEFLSLFSMCQTIRLEYKSETKGRGGEMEISMTERKHGNRTYKKIVERILREYPILMKSIAEYELLHYPPCTTVYEERIGRSYSEYISSTEQFGVQKADKQLQVHRTEQALKILSAKEKKLIEARYFDQNDPIDYAVCHQLRWSRSDYYRVKKRAIQKLALAMNII